MEFEELKRLHEEKRMEQLETVSENAAPQYEWDGLRRRKTMMGSQRGRSMTSPSPFPPLPPTPHPPLGWSHIPTEEELAAADRPASPALSSLVGTIRSRARSVLLPGQPEVRATPDPSKVQSPVHPVQLTEIVVPISKADEGLPTPQPYYSTRARGDSAASGSSSARRVQFAGERGRQPEGGEIGSVLRGPTPPPHSAKRQFSFNNIFRRHQAHDHGGDGSQDTRYRPVSSRGYSNPQVRGATEEERLGLVKGDSQTSQSMPALQHYDEEDDEVPEPYVDDKQSRYGPSITHTPPRRESPPRRGSDEKAGAVTKEDEVAVYQQQRQRFKERSRSNTPPAPPAHRRNTPPSRGGDGAAFI